MAIYQPLPPETPQALAAQIDELRRVLLDDLFRDFDHARTRWLGKTLKSVAWPPASRFVRRIAEFDQVVASAGFRSAVGQLLSTFVGGYRLEGSQNVPLTGPLLVVSNHPGAYDSLVITACLPRDDLYLIATGYPMLRRLPHTSRRMIFFDPRANSQLNLVREVVQHLRLGRAVLIFPRGQVEPDPAVLPGAQETLQRWSPSLELFLRKVPDTQVLVTAVSGVLAPVFLHNPLIRIWRGRREPLVVAETMQVMTQLIFPRLIRVRPRLTFGSPLSVQGLPAGARSVYQEVLEQAAQLLAGHQAVLPDNMR